MKLALIVPGGVDRTGTYRVIPALLWLIERIAREHDVHVFALYQEPQASNYPLLGASVHTIARGRTGRRTLLSILREHRREAFDVLHAFWAMKPGIVAACAGWLLGRPVLLHVAGGELVALPDIGYGGRCGIRGRVSVRIALSGATRISAASAPMQQAVARLGYQAIRLPLGVDQAVWPVLAPRPRDPSRPARLVHVASLNRVKDQHTLMHTMALLAREGIAFTLDVVGADTLDGEIQRAVRSHGLADRVLFHGFLPQDRLRPLVVSADLLVMSSLHEAGPVVVLEAALVGVPTVGTAVGHIAEWAPRAAVAVPVGDCVALCRETSALLADDRRRLNIATVAQARAVHEDATWTAREVLRIYQELAAARRGPGER